MHRLQQHILHQLIHNHRLRYADLKPADVEGNLFMYHLKQLIKQGLVLKCDDGRYELSAEGQAYADRLSLKTLTPRAQPRIVTLIVLQNEAGEYLLYRRKRQPLLGMIGFPYGKIHLGETVAEAANRELKEKTGLSAELTHRGDGYVTIYTAEQPISQIMFHLFIGRQPLGKLKKGTTAGVPLWSSLSVLEPAEVMPSVYDLAKLVTASEKFFVELVYK